MKYFQWKSCLLGLSILTFSQLCMAQVLDSFNPSGQDAMGWHITSDQHGNIYVAGIVGKPGSDIGGPFGSDESWIVRKSSDGGMSWNVVDQFRLVGGLNSEPRSMSYDQTTDRLWVTGTAVEYAGSPGLGGPDTVTHLITRLSVDQGKSWTTVDHYYQPDCTTDGQKLLLDHLGGIYVFGEEECGDELPGKLFFRKSFDGGSTWKTSYIGTSDDSAGTVVDAAIGPDGNFYIKENWTILGSADSNKTFSPVLDHGSDYFFDNIVFSPDGELFVTGLTSVSYNSYLKSSSDGGHTWSTKHVWSDASSNDEMLILSFAVGSDGTIVACGTKRSQTMGDSWFLQTSSDHGQTWSDVDISQLAPGKDADCLGVSFTPDGHILATGSEVNAEGESVWVTQRY